MTDLSTHVLAETIALFRKQKALGEKALAQVSDPDLVAVLDPEANSIAHIVRHLHGNMRSRWTDFLTTDGEKADRHRDTEFELPAGTGRAEVLAWWNAGWGYLFAALDELTPADLTRTVSIRGQPLSVLSAILRQLDHYAQHVGQVVLLAKHARGSEWQTLSIARGKSEEYLRSVRGKA